MTRPRASGARATLELLRAPLLLTPSADVLGGAAWGLAAGASMPWADVGVAALCGTALLSSGMAHNAWVDREEDRRDKPERPLARGSVTGGLVIALWLGGAALALLLASWQRSLLAPTLGILIVSHAYHLGLKRQRFGGCLALGIARGLDMSLGAFALGAARVPLWWLAPLLHASYVAAASLHASTDDEAARPHEARWGLRLAGASLALHAVAQLVTRPLAAAFAGVGMLGFLGLRVSRASGRLPPPALTGVLLSALPLLACSWALAAWQPMAALLALAAFVAAGRARHAFPPS